MATHSRPYISKYSSPHSYISNYSSGYSSGYSPGVNKYSSYNYKTYTGTSRISPSTMSSVDRRYNRFGTYDTTYSSSCIRALPKTPPNQLGRSTSLARDPVTTRQPVKALHSTSMHKDARYGDSSHKGITSSFSDMQLTSRQKDNLLPSIHTEKPYGGSRNTDAESIRSRRANSPSRRRSASMDRSHSATRTRDPSERGRATDKITEKPLERTTHGRAATLDRTLSERTSILDRTGERDRTYNTHMSYSSSSEGLVGLSNLGNTCFMNSVLQCLSNTKLLRNYCLNNYNTDINRKTSKMKGALFKAYATLMSKMWTGSNTSVSPKDFKSQIQEFAPRFVGYRQQDSQEFLLYLLEGLHEDVNRVTEKGKYFIDDSSEVETISASDKAKLMWDNYIKRDDSKLVDLFVGQLKSALRCSICDYTSNTFDPLWNLTLPIKKKAYGEMSLLECFDMFTQEEVLEGHESPTCAKCQERRKCTKRLTIQKFPTVLILSLKRFDHGSFRSKLTTTVNFPLENLDLKQYSSGQTSKPVLYDLYAVSVHSGTTYTGHYTAYCKHSETGDWHYYNDGSVTKVTPARVKGAEAYVLFYQRSLTGNPRL